jgi:hypothetical protein
VLALKTKEKLGETQFTTKIDGFVSPFVIILDKSVFSVQFEMKFLFRVQNLPIFGPHRN